VTNSVLKRINCPGFWASSASVPNAGKYSGGVFSSIVLLCLIVPGIIITAGQEDEMKKILITLLLVGVLCISATSTVFAGGDKVRGNNGQGSVNQVQVQDPPPFQP
jgi:hypothetical protein